MPTKTGRSGTAKATARPAKPRDHLPKNVVRAEALDTPLEFVWDDEAWTVTPADATGLEFLAALEDEQIITALRLLLGTEQAARFIKGRRAEDLYGFFDALGEVVGSGNP